MMPPYADPLVVNPSAPLMPRLDILDAEIVSIEEHPPAPAQTKEIVPWVAPPAYSEPRRSLARRAIDDPYWILMGAAGLVGMGIVGTITYVVFQVVIAIATFLGLYGKGLLAIAALVTVCSLCAGAKAVCCCCGK